MDATTGFSRAATGGPTSAKEAFRDSLRKKYLSGEISWYQVCQLVSVWVHGEEIRRDKSSYYNSHICSTVDAPEKYPELNLEPYTEEEKALAEVHDVLEKRFENLADNWTLDDFCYMGGKESFLDKLDIISKPKDGCYFEYIMQLSYDRSALKVKVADSHHNSITGPSKERAEIYAITIPYMQDILAGKIHAGYDISLYASQIGRFNHDLFMCHGPNLILSTSRHTSEFAFH